MEINALISAGDETGRFTVCLDGWSYPELIHKFGGGITVFLEFLGHGIWAFSNPQEDESINRNIGHGELCGWQSWDSGGSQVCGAAVHFSMCIQSAIATDWSWDSPVESRSTFGSASNSISSANELLRTMMAATQRKSFQADFNGKLGLIHQKYLVCLSWGLNARASNKSYSTAVWKLGFPLSRHSTGINLSLRRKKPTKVYQVRFRTGFLFQSEKSSPE